MDRLSTGNMVVHIYSMACKSLPQGPIIQFTYYFHRVNVVEGEPDDRPMTTGNHTVRDIYCCKCGTTLGWKYVNALSIYPSTDSDRACRTRRTNSLKNTRKANISLSVISSWTFNRYHAQSPARIPTGRYYTLTSSR